MYGGGHSSKFRHAAPRAKRLQPPNRPSLGGSAGRNGPGVEEAATTTTTTTTTTPRLSEEAFSLVSSGNPLAFSMIIRLAPDMVEEMKRVEAHGGRTRVKFDSSPYNPGGNIIDVGGKQFRFTWSQEFGDLCDIYEERQSGEDGNGLLVESGSAWRKLNVQRILDESTKNHVKMRSEEAERKLKSRKAIVLEPGNPSMRNQIKALAAVEATPWKTYNKKKETAPPKKRKAENLQVGSPPKSTYKPGLLSTTVTKGRHSSPLSSPPDQSAASSSPLGTVNFSKGIDDAVPSQMIGKQDTNTGSDKGIPTRTNNAMRYTPGGKANNIAKPIDLQSMLISLLMNKPNGLTLKALEKAVQDKVPNPIKKIKPIVRKIASYKSPGRYILLPGVDLESFKKPPTESGRSLDDSHPQLPAREECHDETPAPQGGFKEKVPNDDLEELVQLSSNVEEESKTLEKINVQHASPDILGEKKGSDLSERQGGSCSDGGSDSDSESDSSDSGSGSESHSRSRSRSPSGRGSESISDSENDATSKSKEGSDEDDEKKTHYKTEPSDKRVSSLIPLKSPDGRSLQYEIHEKQDDNESDATETEKNLPEEQETEMALTTATIYNKGGKVAEDMPFSPDHEQLQECPNYLGNLSDERGNGVRGSSRHEQFDSCERLFNGKCKRDSDVKNIDEKTEHIKRSTAENLGQARGSPGMGVQMFESSHSFSPVGFTKETFKDLTVQAVNRGDKNGNSNVGLQRGYNLTFMGKSTSDLTQTVQRSIDQTLLGKSSNPLEKSDKQGESLWRRRKHSEKDFHVREDSSMQKDKCHRDAQNEDIHATGKKVSRNSRDGSNGSKQSLSLDSHRLKQGEMVGKLNEGRPGTHSHIAISLKDNNRIGLDKSPIINGRGVSLQRELSNLELGELRDSTPDDTHDAKQFERKKSFKDLETRANTSEERNLDVVKPSLKAILESRKLPSAFVSSGFPSNLESTNKRNAGNHFEDSTRLHARIMQSHPQHLKAVNVEIGSQNKLAEMNGRFRSNESEVSQGNELEVRSESNSLPANAFEQHDSKPGIVPYPVKESKRQTPNSLEEVADRGTGSWFADKNNSDQNRRESSSDEDSCPYLKYEKDEPELKGPIRTFSQYKEYVQEFHDKYDCYSSLCKNLESYRNEFYEIGKDLKYAKDRDVDGYNNILGQLKESYQRYGMKHKRLKKIYVVLHLELEHLKQRIKDYVDAYNKK